MIMKQCVDSGQWVRVVYIMSYKGTYKHQCTAQGDVFPQLTTGCQQFPEQQTKSDHHQPEGTSLSPSLSHLISPTSLNITESRPKRVRVMFRWEYTSSDRLDCQVFIQNWLVESSAFCFTIRYWQTSDLTAWEKFPPSCEIQYLWMSSSFYNSY